MEGQYLTGCNRARVVVCGPDHVREAGCCEPGCEYVCVTECRGFD